MNFTYHRMTALLAARNCFNAGATVAEIAASAKKHPSTIRRWLKITEHMRANP
jgi:hypothetical protein